MTTVECMPMSSQVRARFAVRVRAVYMRACVTVCARMRVLRRDILLVLVGRGGRAARSLRGVGRPLQRDAPPHLLTTYSKQKQNIVGGGDAGPHQRD